MNKLPIIANIRAALYYTYANIGLVAKVSAVWIGLYALYTLVFSLLGIAEYLELTDAVAFVTESPRDARARGYERLEVLLPKLAVITAELGPLIQVHDIFDKLIRLVAYGSVAVGMHRSFMLDEELPRISFEGREFKYIIHMIIYMAILGGLALLLVSLVVSIGIAGAMQGIFYVFIGLALLFLAARFLMVFPAIAVGNPAINPLKSWSLTKGNGLGLFWGLLLAILSSLPVAIFKVTVAKIALPLVIIWPVQVFLSMIILTFVLVFLSICYQNLTSPQEDKTIGPLY
ncbi:MAG: hypothetical protein COB24_07335 [Hyphomicrobiales bacterium]|nr:MAG: hypothetical protein COB24_07335 [Hyphomicrobiales bacterium]